MSDAPDGPEELRGGKEGGDPALEGATETGRQGVGYSETGSQVDDGTSQLPAEKSGNASGGAT
jgi:hypothetical protein